MSLACLLVDYTLTIVNGVYIWINWLFVGMANFCKWFAITTKDPLCKKAALVCHMETWVSIFWRHNLCRGFDRDGNILYSFACCEHTTNGVGVWFFNTNKPQGDQIIRFPRLFELLFLKVSEGNFCAIVWFILIIVVQSIHLLDPRSCITTKMQHRSIYATTCNY